MSYFSLMKKSPNSDHWVVIASVKEYHIEKLKYFTNGQYSKYCPNTGIGSERLEILSWDRYLEPGHLV